MPGRQSRFGLDSDFDIDNISFAFIIQHHFGDQWHFVLMERDAHVIADRRRKYDLLAQWSAPLKGRR
jgi:hypothetical protein